MAGSRQQDGTNEVPTTVRMLVGLELRRLRERREITRAEAGEPIRASESKISRMELGRVGFKERDVRDLLTLYGVHDEAEREAFLARVRDANAPPWWRPYSDVVPPWFQQYLGLEATATLIRTYQVQFVPGLLQTEEYARAVIRLNNSTRPEEVDRRVQLRMQRQQLLQRPDPPRLWAVLDEAALQRPVGGRRVMRDQLEALAAAVTKMPHVQLQIVPLASGGHSASGGSFSILRFPHEDLPDIVYVEQLTSALFLNKREDVDAYTEALHHLYVEAEPPTRTVDVLDDVLRRS